jgi:hypothetical protein
VPFRFRLWHLADVSALAYDRFAPDGDLQAKDAVKSSRPEYQEPKLRSNFLTCRSAHMLRGDYNF